MKTIEEKAKAYDEALEKAKEIVSDKNASSVWKGWLCNCFPELAESNDVDFEKELERLDSFLYDLDGVAIKGTTHYLTVENVKNIAQRFYELGLNSQKGGDE
jgi:hypothetical protein